jgi:hypothetical protein
VFSLGCGSAPSHTPANEISYDDSKDGEIWFRHSQIELRFDYEMYCRVFFKKDGTLISINDIPPDPARARPPHYLEVDGAEVKDFQVDYRNVGASEMKTEFGTGKALHLTGYAKTPSGIELEKNLTAEFYQEYPDTVLLAVTYRNLEKTRRIQITKTVNNFFRLDSARTQSQRPAFAFQGVLGRPDLEGDNSFEIRRQDFARTFQTPASMPDDLLTVPLLDLWNPTMGMAIGDISRPPRVLLLPVRVTVDQKVEISMQSTDAHELGPGEVLATPKSLWMVHRGGMPAGFNRYSTLVRSGVK